jgi:hypothetical protein
MTTSSPYEKPLSLAEVKARAEATLDRHSRSYVADALVFARFILEHMGELEAAEMTEPGALDLSRDLQGNPIFVPKT